MEDLQVEDFNDPIEHKAEQTADGIKAPENQGRMTRSKPPFSKRS